MSAPSGLIIVDKPAGWTSHDVVARLRRLAGTRRVGHAGTLDPMATGVLVVGVEKATRLLGHLALTDKEYEATIRLGQATDTGDAEGSVTSGAPAAGVALTAVRAAAARLTGEVQQVPPAVSAIKVGGRRSYQLARAGKPPELPPRTVTVAAFEVLTARCENDLLDVEVTVTCSSGTYVRALARDLGEALGVGGHLTRLRRRRVGHYDLSQARTLDQLAEAAASDLVMPMSVAAAAAFPSWHLTQDQARSLAFGSKLPGAGLPGGPVAALSPDGGLVALVEERAGVVRPVAVFAEPPPAELSAAEPSPPC
ncbi:MAG TPA: tRNA pseudouridine(55) synthase TruB [Streptosporangiaceae bacterium]|nr:tRNA pseudouridine(55) synthase TruB [Streptosporangiaceae bacterium]